jgi:hypothetical protein
MATAKGVTDLSLALARAAGEPAVASSAEQWVIAAGLVAAFLLLYRVSLWVHPMHRCRRCGGTGRVAGWFPGSAGFCRRCDNGLAPRLGTRVLDLRGRSAR